MSQSMEALGKIGYVANSTFTVLGDSMSAGRLYDRICDKAIAKVRHVLPKGVICSVRHKDLLWWPPEEFVPPQASGKSAN